MTGAPLALALLLAGAPGDPGPAAAPVAALACPPGSVLKGQAPPLGFEEWCDGPDRAGIARRQGPARTWYAPGLIHQESTWRNGQLEGPWREFHRDGRRAIEGRHRAGERDGDWSWWREDGSLEEQVSYDLGRRHGRFVQWWASGKRRTEGQFCFGVQCGRWVTWSEEGRELGAVEYERVRDRP